MKRQYAIPAVPETKNRVLYHLHMIISFSHFLSERWCKKREEIQLDNPELYTFPSDGCPALPSQQNAVLFTETVKCT